MYVVVLKGIASIRRFYLVQTTYFNFEANRKVDQTYYASWPGSIINPQWLKLPLSRTNFHSPKGVRAIKVRL